MLDVVLIAWNCWAGVRGSGKDQVVLGLCTSAAEEQTLHYQLPRQLAIISISMHRCALSF